MSIAAANLFTRNIYTRVPATDATPRPRRPRSPRSPRWWSRSARCSCILLLDPQFSIDLQLIGGVIILQTLPPLALGPLHAAGSTACGADRRLGARAWRPGCWMLYTRRTRSTGKAHFGGGVRAVEARLRHTKITIYAGILALVVNLVVGFAVTALVRMGKRSELPDETEPGDYEVEAGDRGVGPLPETPIEEQAVPANR